MSKLVGPLGWIVTGFAATQLFDDCQAKGATRQEAGAITALDEGLVTSFLVPELENWLDKRLKDAFLRMELAGGPNKVNTVTEAGLYTAEDAAVIKRASAHQMRKMRKKTKGTAGAWKRFGKGAAKQWEPGNPTLGDLQESKNYQRSNKIKIKINS